ncbi:MAG: hypothetical protein ACK5H2_06725 [Beutenbergiaceae bacterium]
MSRCVLARGWWRRCLVGGIAGIELRDSDDDLMYIEVALPTAAWGKPIDMQIRVEVDAGQPAGTSAVLWTKMALTKA